MTQSLNETEQGQGYDKEDVDNSATETAQNTASGPSSGAMPLPDNSQQIGQDPGEPADETAAGGLQPANNTGQSHADGGYGGERVMTEQEEQEQRQTA